MSDTMVKRRAPRRASEAVPSHAARPAAPPSAETGLSDIDRRTPWPTHRIRWCLSLAPTDAAAFAWPPRRA